MQPDAQTHHSYQQHPQQETPTHPPHQVQPVPVVKVLSPMGVEYVFLTITLFAGAIALTSLFLLLVNGQTFFEALAFPAATLLVTLPIFTLLFMHLKRMEIRNPNLRLDASKRRSTQFTQIAAFIVSLLTLISFVFAIFGQIGGQSDLSIVKAGLDALCILVVSGGLLAYYWRDEHKVGR